MTNRRELLQGALAAAALPLAVKFDPVMAAAGTLPQVVVPQVVVVDTRFAASAAFARQFRLSGATVRAITGDVTALWYRDLHVRWQTEPTTVVGLTAHGALFCLERLGWDYDLRLNFRAEHSYRGGQVRHELCSLDSSGSGVAALNAAAEHWPEALAEMLIQRPIAGTPLVPGFFVGSGQSTTTDVGNDHPESLYSWQLTPRARVRRST
jgi:hypothetical protein